MANMTYEVSSLRYVRVAALAACPHCLIEGVFPVDTAEYALRDRCDL